MSELKLSPQVTEIIDKYYPAGTPLRDIYMRHCESVAALALEIVDLKHLPLPYDLVVSAAMLHDIGIFLTYAPSIHCTGTQPYICHGVLGAELLRQSGVEEPLARVAELHTGAGLSAAEIVAQNLPLPHRDFIPESLLERLICYADKFYSKSGDMKRKSVDKVRGQMARFGTDSLMRFDALHSEFS